MIPPCKRSPADGWIDGEHLVLPRQKLSPAEIEPFLEYLLSSVVRKPKQLKLRETSGVVRYLKALVMQEPHSLQRDVVERVADMIWGALLQSGQIAIAEKEAVVQFLLEHRRTYFASFDVDQMSEFVRHCTEPSSHKEFFRVPKLMGRARLVSGQGPARLQDDLTERIYVAYHALRRFKVRDARGRVADVLNRMGFRTRPRSTTDASWGSAEVSERVQQFECRMVHQHRLAGKADRRKEIERLRNMRIDSWIHRFHYAVGTRIPFRQGDSSEA